MKDDGSQARKRAHNDLFDRIREGWLRPVLAQAPVAVLVIDRQSIVQDISRREENFNPSSVIGRSVYEFVDSAYHDVTRRAVQKVFDGGGNVSFPSLAGEVDARAYYENHLGPIVEGGEIVAVAIVAIEVTRRQEAEERRRAAEDRLRRLVATMAEGFVIVDLEERILDANRAAHEIFGIQEGELVGHSLLEMIPESERELIRRQSKARSEGETSSFEHPIRLPGGEIRHLRVHATPVVDENGKMVATEALFSDITEAVRSKESLERREAQFRTLVENLPGAVYRSDAAPPWRKHLISSGILGLTGYPVEDFTSGRRSLWGLIIEEDLKRVATAAMQAAETRGTYEVEYRILDAAGKARWVQDRGKVILDCDGTPTFLDGVVLDIDERRRVEEALSESEERFRTIVEEAPAVTFVLDGQGVFVLSEGHALANLGLEPGEAVGASVFEMYVDYPAILDGVRGALAGETSRSAVDVGDRSFDAFYSPRFDGQGQVIGVFGMAFDVTESRRLERQLRDKQKMEAIGTLAGGVAHDFNNILLAMLGTAELALEDLPDSSSVREDLEEILRFGDRAVELIRQLLSFSRPGHQVRETILVGQTIDDVLQLARAALPTTIRIDRRIELASAQVEAAPTELHQILLNLVTNAGQAMDAKGGILEIRLAETEEPPAHPGIDREKSPSWVVLEVRDTGHGMSEEIQQRIFEPFFTTKEDHRGTGMGLSVVHSLVDSLGGVILVESAPGRGSTFSVLLPRSDSEAPAAKEASAKAEIETSDGKRHHILVVDDEPGIVNMLARMLESLGYRVTACNSASQALDVVHEKGDSIDLVLSDQTMPEFTGLQLTRMLLRIRDDLPVILMTGFSHALTEQKAQEAGARLLLTKPIRRAQLDRILGDVLS